ncbi:MAG TPA: hypothetical protein VK742_20435 [Candidatus Sulfotelmatobacter sp.]|jgi:hypothetical protein|nr:hypothetical protein [Candidatus Sulfotelmatobacter sp.]
MPWNTIDTESIINSLTPVEQSILQNIQGFATGLQDKIATTILRVRSKIKAGGNPLDGSNPLTVPDSLAEEVIAIARWRFLSDFPGLKSLKTKEREQASKDAEDMLNEISSNKPNRPRTELPLVPDTAASPVNAVGIARRGRRLETGSFDKIGET